MIHQQTIAKAQKGDQRAMKDIFHAQSKALFMLCLRYIPHQADAEDVLSAAFSKIFEKLASFKYQGEGSLEAWMRQVVVNECLMFLRKKQKAPMMVEPDSTITALEDNAINQLTNQELYQLILQLPEGYRTVFNLYEIEGYNHSEISEKLNISVGTSKSQLSKAKAYLKNLIIKNGWYNAS
ncbi:RNA polymerase sigma factor [Mongoliitalea daihaiensis]|nr:RNA polymerase sigma factor [Mongoliitalea daihaiensis]